MTFVLRTLQLENGCKRNTFTINTNLYNAHKKRRFEKFPLTHL